MSFATEDEDKAYADNDIKGELSRKSHLKGGISNYESDSSSEDYENREEKRDEPNSEDDMFGYESDMHKKEHNEAVKKDEGLLSDDDFAQENSQDSKSNHSANKGNIYAPEEQGYTDQPKEEQVDYYTRIESYDDVLSGHDKMAKRAPQIEQFAMEENEAEVDEDGNYVPSRNVEENQDEQWMNIGKRDLLEVKKAQTKREELTRRERRTKQLTELAPLSSLLKTLIHLLGERETPMQALALLLPRKSRNKQIKNNMPDIEERVRRATAIRITDLCESLIENKGISEAYELPKERLIILYKEETGESYNNNARKRTYEELETEDKPSDPRNVTDNSRKWEFKWPEDEIIHSIYSDYEMYYWSQNYFTDNVVVRKKGDLDFVPIREVSFQP